MKLHSEILGFPGLGVGIPAMAVGRNRRAAEVGTNDRVKVQRAGGSNLTTFRVTGAGILGQPLQYRAHDCSKPPTTAALVSILATTLPMVTGGGALAGIIVGLVIALALVNTPSGHPYGIHAGIYGLMANVIVAIVVTLTESPRSDAAPSKR